MHYCALQVRGVVGPLKKIEVVIIENASKQYFSLYKNNDYDYCRNLSSFCPSSCRDKRSLLRAGKVMSMTSSTMACNQTRGFC